MIYDVVENSSQVGKIHCSLSISNPRPPEIKDSTPQKSNELTPKIAILKGSYLFQTIASPVGLCHENARPYFFGGMRISQDNQTEMLNTMMGSNP